MTNTKANIVLASGLLLSAVAGSKSFGSAASSNPFDQFDSQKPIIWYDWLFRFEQFHPKETPQKSTWPRYKQIQIIVNKALETLSEIGRMSLELIHQGRIPNVKTPHAQILAIMLNTDFDLYSSVYNQLYPTDSMEDIQQAYTITQGLVTNQEYLLMITDYFLWVLDGKNVVVVGEEMQKMFEHTSLKDVTSENMGLPLGRSVYIALPGFKGRVWGEEENGSLEGYYIRGVVVSHILDPEGIPMLKFSFWGKPKFVGTIISDHFYQENVPAEGGNLEEKIKGLNIWKAYNQPQEAVDSMVLAMRISINTLLYWHNMGNRVDMVHPFLVEIRDKIKQVEAKLSRYKKGSKKWRSHNQHLQNLKNKLQREGNWSYIDPLPMKKATKANPKSELGTKRTSPVRHINRGHWKRSRSGNRIFIAPYMAGTRIPTEPRYWASILDKYKVMRGEK